MLGYEYSIYSGRLETYVLQALLALTDIIMGLCSLYSQVMSPNPISLLPQVPDPKKEGPAIPPAVR